MAPTYSDIKRAMKAPKGEPIVGSPLIPSTKKYALVNPHKYKRTIIIDGHNLIHKCRTAKYWATMKTTSGRPSGHVYGAYSKIMAFLKVHCFKPEIPTAIVVVSDEYSEPRKEILPSYKAHRERSNEITNIIEEGLELLYCFPHLLASIPSQDKEADDIIGAFITQNPNMDHFVLSSDRDLWQMWGKARFFEKHDKEFTDDDYKKAYGRTPPKMIPLYKALYGDKSDGIPKVKGLGDSVKKDIIRILCKIKKPNHIFKDKYIDSLPDKAAIAIMHSGIKIKRNYKVAKIKFKSKIEVEPHEFDLPRLKTMLKKFECKVHIDSLKSYRLRLGGLGT